MSDDERRRRRRADEAPLLFFNQSIKEEKVQLMQDSCDDSSKYTIKDSHSSEHSQACNDENQTDKSLQQIAQHSTVLNFSNTEQIRNAEGCTDITNEVGTSRSSDSDEYTQAQPDFSIIEGEVCLDAMSIRELQEAFRATFGRQTSVKDKLWLKRRIAMGLTNSCNVPTTDFVIKENKIFLRKVEDYSMVQKVMLGTKSHPDQVSRLHDIPQASPAKQTGRTEDKGVSGKRIREHRERQETKEDENIQNEPNAGKRVRKPTKRFIEELSDGETKECAGRLGISAKASGDAPTSSKSHPRSIHDIGSWRTTFVMREGAFGVSNLRFSSANRVRRRRPRKNFAGFVNFVNGERKRSDTEAYNNTELDLEHGKLDLAEENSEAYADIVPVIKVGGKRKHHRAWTLSEVSKLVEGVARYGAGRWSEIKRLTFASYSYRTSVDLKDKWRNLLRASFAQGSLQQVGSTSRKHAAASIPTPILSRVRELAEMQSQVGIEFGPNSYACQGERVVQEIRAGFL